MIFIFFDGQPTRSLIKMIYLIHSLAIDSTINFFRYLYFPEKQFKKYRINSIREQIFVAFLNIINSIKL